MEKVLLTRSWEAKQYDPKLPDNALPDTAGEWFPALVPGAIQYDLAALGKPENPDIHGV